MKTIHLDNHQIQVQNISKNIWSTQVSAFMDLISVHFALEPYIRRLTELEMVDTFGGKVYISTEDIERTIAMFYNGSILGYNYVIGFQPNGDIINRHMGEIIGSYNGEGLQLRHWARTSYPMPAETAVMVAARLLSTIYTPQGFEEPISLQLVEMVHTNKLIDDATFEQYKAAL